MDYHWAGQQLVSSGKNLPHHVVWTLVVAIAIAIAISLDCERHIGPWFKSPKPGYILF
jgi:hypothetical protein